MKQSPLQQRLAICTAGNAKFFEHLDGLVASLESARLPPTWNVCMLDVGLTLVQRANFASRNVRVLAPEWSLDFPKRQANPNWFKAMVNRPFLPQHFPGYEIYLWVDADAWVQNPGCLLQLAERTYSGAVALVIEKFGPPQRYRFTGTDGVLYEGEFSEQINRQSLEKCYMNCFGPDKAHFAQSAVTNSGVFAIRGDSLAWSVWQQYLAFGLRNGAGHVLVEQQALNLAYLENKLSIQSMPIACNWNMTTFHPLLDLDRGLLVDPSDHGTPVGVVHLTDLKRLSEITLKTTRGESVQVPLSYREFVAKFRSQKG